METFLDEDRVFLADLLRFVDGGRPKDLVGSSSLLDLAVSSVDAGGSSAMTGLTADEAGFGFVSAVCWPAFPPSTGVTLGGAEGARGSRASGEGS